MEGDWKRIRISLVWVSGWWVRYVWGVPIVKRARGRDLVCGAAIVGIPCPIGIYLRILLQDSLV